MKYFLFFLDRLRVVPFLVLSALLHSCIFSDYNFSSGKKKRVRANSKMSIDFTPTMVNKPSDFIIPDDIGELRRKILKHYKNKKYKELQISIIKVSSFSNKKQKKKPKKFKNKVEEFVWNIKSTVDPLWIPLVKNSAGGSGDLMVGIEVLRSGKIQDVNIIQNSHTEYLDKKIINLLKSVDFPTPPKSIIKSKEFIVLTWKFSLESAM